MLQFEFSCRLFSVPTSPLVALRVESFSINGPRAKPLHLCRFSNREYLSVGVLNNDALDELKPRHIKSLPTRILP